MTGTARIAILDYGMGNLRSVEKALEHVGATAEITSDGDAVRAADGVILPGVGAFPKAMEEIRGRGLDELIAERRDAGIPILGICLGLQLLFESTTELGGAEGLGLLPGRGRRARRRWPQGPPHRLVRRALGAGVEADRRDRVGDALLLRPLLRADAEPATSCSAASSYGERFCCAAQRDNVFGVQFHPEKSSAAGLRLLSNFAGICAAVPA